MREFSKYVGLDTHKDTIAVAVCDALGGKSRYFGEIANTPEAVRKMVKDLCPDGEILKFCYEAGPCGYVLHRQITALGHECTVVAPSLIPTKPGDRVKTDRRDSEKLSRLDRAEELTPVWIPDIEQEAMRDLTRAREDMKGFERAAKQRLNAFLLRHGCIYDSEKSRWTQAHYRWLEARKFDNAIQQIVFQEYLETVKQALAREAGLVTEMEKALGGWVFGPVVEALMALRGIKLVAAMTVMAELGDITRFDSPSQLMKFLGLVPSEKSSGANRRQGGITKAGNGHVRRVLIEAGWCYRFPARKTAHLQRYAEKCSDEVQSIAWKAQKRLCGRYSHLIGKGKIKVQVCTAIARELVGFIWAIACETMSKSIASAR